MVTTYRLDGAETEVAAGRSGTARATAKWDGDKIIITTKTEAGESTQTWSIDSSGDLKIESTGAMGPVTRTYKKTK